MDKQNLVETMKCYSVLKSKAILTHTTTEMNLEDTTLHEISQDKNDMIPLPRDPQSNQSQRQWNAGCQGLQ